MILAALLSGAMAQGLQTQTDVKAVVTPEQKRRESFAVGKQMLLDKGVPFDPEELLVDGWPKRLAPIFEAMPEMHRTIREGQYVEGVVIADTLYLPETSRFRGNVFILVRHVVFEGSHSNFSSAPSGNEKAGALYLYPLAPMVVMDMTLEEAMAKANSVRQGPDENPEWPPYSAIKFVVIEKPHTVTIDNSARAPDPKPESKPR
jgi:hypothetical protein